MNHLGAVLNFELSFDLRQSVLEVLGLHHDAVIGLPVADHIEVFGDLLQGGLGLEGKHVLGLEAGLGNAYICR